MSGREGSRAAGENGKAEACDGDRAEVEGRTADDGTHTDGWDQRTGSAFRLRTHVVGLKDGTRDRDQANDTAVSGYYPCLVSLRDS